MLFEKFDACDLMPLLELTMEMLSFGDSSLSIIDVREDRMLRSGLGDDLLPLSSLLLRPL